MPMSASNGVAVLEIKSNTAKIVPPRAKEVSTREAGEVAAVKSAKARLPAATKKMTRGSRRWRDILLLAARRG